MGCGPLVPTRPVGTEWFNLHGNVGYARATFLLPYATSTSSDIFVGANTDSFDECTEPAA
jgi:hypothetical protein